MFWKIYFEYFNTDDDQTGDSFYKGDFSGEDWDGNGADEERIRLLLQKELENFKRKIWPTIITIWVNLVSEIMSG